MAKVFGKHLRCFVFDFPTAYAMFYSTLSEEVKERMVEKKLNGKELFFTN